MVDRTRWPLVFAGLLVSCNLAPNYQRPEAPVSARFPATDGSGRAGAADPGWRQIFSDPRLGALVELALRNNRDLRVAALNVELVAAQYRIARAPVFPLVSGVAGADVTGTSDGIGAQYRVGLGLASFELDLFGRVRNLRAQALQQYLASEEARRAAHISLVAQVASQYLVQRTFAEQRVIAEQAVITAERSVDLTRRLLGAGQRSALDAHTAEARAHAARAEVARLDRLLAQADNALALLIGQALPEGLPPPLPLDHEGLIADIPVGLPSDLLQRRPDILAAEHQLIAANANIGAARAAFFPRISLTGFAGFASTALTSLFTSGAALLTLSPTLSVPLFTGGETSANLDVARVRKRIEVARYEQTILIAFREVADALVARGSLETQLEAQLARATAEQKRFELSDARYRSGIESYLVVLTAEQDLYAARAQLVELRAARLANLVDLYRALGGGWRR